MTTQNTPVLPDISCWHVQTLRVTAFPSPSATISQPKWWSELLGTEPEVRNLRPARGELIEKGPFDKGTLTLQVFPLRIDWNLTVIPEAHLDDPDMPHLGSLPETGEKFIKLMSDWLSNASAPRLQRLAFGAVLNQAVGSREEGYHLLAKYLPEIRLSPESTDFLYQINRPGKSAVPSSEGRSINRLSKWSCVAMHRTIVQYFPDGTPSTSPVGVASYACNLELDISTPGDFKEDLPQQTLAQILQEQYNFGIDIALRGDIA
jgi:hypothetical protein